MLLTRQRRAVFTVLEELNFSFNLVEDEEALIYPVAQFQKLTVLVVTGNPFALGGDPYATNALENIMNGKTLGAGRIINETMNPASYLRRQKSRKSGSDLHPLMLGYLPSSNRELVIVNDQAPKTRYLFSREENELFPGQHPRGAQMLSDDDEPPKALEY